MTINLFFINIYPLLPEIFLLLVVFFSLIFGSILSNYESLSLPVPNNSINFFIFLSLLLSLLLSINTSIISISFWNNLLIFDYFTLYSKILILFFSLIWIWIFYSKKQLINFEFWVLILLSIIAILFLIQSNDLLSIYINVEFLSLTFYILASFQRNSEFSTESGLKYFILGAFASSLLLFGFSLLYSFTGLTNLQDLFVLFNNDLKYTLTYSFYWGILLSIFCVLTSLLFKLGVAPFHFWLPDVYEGAFTPVTSFFAILPKLPLLLLLIKFIFGVFLNFAYSEIYYYLLFCTSCTSLVGTFGAFAQKKWKRFIAFSSISHLSFFLLNICTLNPLNLVNLIIYLIIYLIMTCNFFSFFNSFNSFKFPFLYSKRYLSSLNFLNILNPILGVSFTILLFSLAGIPPLLGFYSKFFVLFSAISQQFLGIVLLLLILNCIACFYYIKLIRQTYFSNFNSHLLPIYVNLSTSNSLVLGISLFLILFSFTNIDLFFLLSNLICLYFLN